MALSQAILTFKKNLTSDVFELHYTLSEEKIFVAGQFLTFILPHIGGRAYSILEYSHGKIVLVIKRWSSDMGGRWGSMMLCDAAVWTSFRCVGPAGHFVLGHQDTSRLFLATGTGLVPLYSQIVSGLSQTGSYKYQLVFWVRTKQDLYYVEKFEALKRQFPDTFYYHLVVSRDIWNSMIHQGYVTDFITEKSVQSFEEYYICGAPNMIESCQDRLSQFGISPEKVFFEKYI